MSGIDPTLSPSLVPQGPAGGAGQLPDILGPVPLPAPFTWLPYLAACGMLLLFALLFFFWLRQKNKTSPPVPPWQTARARLEQLRELRQAGNTLAYLDGISMLLRSYLEERFGFRCSSTTTEEFFQRNREADWPLSRTSRESLRRCLQTCDLAKYAKLVPDDQVLIEVEQEVQRFLAATSQQPGEEG